MGVPGTTEAEDASSLSGRAWLSKDALVAWASYEFLGLWTSVSLSVASRFSCILRLRAEACSASKGSPGRAPGNRDPLWMIASTRSGRGATNAERQGVFLLPWPGIRSPLALPKAVSAER